VGEAPRIPRQSAHGGGKVVNPNHRLPLPPVDIPGSHFHYRLSRRQGLVQPEGLIDEKSQRPIGNRKILANIYFMFIYSLYVYVSSSCQMARFIYPD
jgi:hypothetical protein